MDIVCWKNELHVQFALLSTIHVVSSSWCSKGIFHVIDQTRETVLHWDIQTPRRELRYLDSQRNTVLNV